MLPDPRDAALRRACPCVGMPLFSELEPMDAGQRIVVATNGVFMQFKNAWLDCSVQIGVLAPAMTLPYGNGAEAVGFAFGVIPMRLLEDFIECARASLPNEAAGALVYNPDCGSLRLAMHEPLAAGPGHIRYRVADMGEDELLAVDLHTHGELPAFWSNTDDADDRGGARVCGVFGHLGRERPSARFRLALNGMFLPLPNPWEGEG